MKCFCRIVLFTFIAFITFVTTGFAGDKAGHTQEVKRGIRAEGACAIVGMSAEQCQLTALQRARAMAIEEAAGISVTSGTLVTNFSVASDFIKTYARGFIIHEKIIWLPLGQYQKDPSVAPIPEYRVRITADVSIPKSRMDAVHMKAKLNNKIFRNGEKASFSLSVSRRARFAVFNIMADDRVVRIFPNVHEPGNLLVPGKVSVFPAKDGKIELEMQTLPGHERDAEAFLVIAWEESADIRIMDLFPEATPMGFSEFFSQLSKIAGRIEETILPYEVVTGR